MGSAVEFERNSRAMMNEKINEMPGGVDTL